MTAPVRPSAPAGGPRLRVLSLGAGVQSLELAWAAGFFDGEGNTRLERSGDGLRSYIRVSIGQTHEEPLHRFKAAVGGHGKVYGPYDRGAKWQPIWTYTARGQSASAVLAAILPFCSSPKRIQAETAIAEAQSGAGLDHCKNKPACPKGHLYDLINTYIDPRGFRHCRSCQRERDQKRRRA